MNQTRIKGIELLVACSFGGIPQENKTTFFFPLNFFSFLFSSGKTTFVSENFFLFIGKIYEWEEWKINNDCWTLISYCMVSLPSVSIWRWPQLQCIQYNKSRSSSQINDVWHINMSITETFYFLFIHIFCT